MLSCDITRKWGSHYALAASFGFGAPNANIISDFRLLLNPHPTLSSSLLREMCAPFVRMLPCFFFPTLPSSLLSIPSPPMTNIVSSSGSSDKASRRAGGMDVDGNGIAEEQSLQSRRRDWPSSIFAVLFRFCNLQRAAFCSSLSSLVSLLE